jgi:microcystin-dependent protein
MAEPFVAEIRVFGFNFPPKGWAACNGQLLPIAQNTALFSLLGTTYGGDGRSTFGLPDLRSRFPVHAGQGPGLTSRSLGEVGGSAEVALNSAQVPAHTHALMAALSPTSPAPAGNALAPINGGAAAYRSGTVAAVMATSSIGPAGGGQPHENRHPYQALQFCIALVGVYPPRA